MTCENRFKIVLRGCTLFGEPKEPTGSFDDLRSELPGITPIQVIHVTGEESLDEACRVAEQGVDALLRDSGNQRLPVKVLGGTGRTDDWSISRRIRQAVAVPIFLAGGLYPENVVHAIS